MSDSAASAKIAPVSVADLYAAGRELYVSSFESFLLSWKADEDENNLLGWFTVSVGSDPNGDDGIPRLIALGYVTGLWEDWNDAAFEEPLGLTENARMKEEREWADAEIPDVLFDYLYGARIMQVRLLEYAKAGDDKLRERLEALWKDVVIANTEFDRDPTEELLLGVRSLFDLGLGLSLYLRWLKAMNERGVPEDDRWNDIGLAPVYADRLADLALPVTVSGCTLDLADSLGYELRSDGKLGGFHSTAFLAQGEVANVVQFVTSGRLGTRETKSMEPVHAEALRQLGFTEAEFPDGQRYRLSSWGGLSGLRKIKG